VDAFCGGVGIAGMLMGTALALRGARPTPASSPSSQSPQQSSPPAKLDTPRGGLGSWLHPPLLDKAYYDEAWGIDENEARRMCLRLARKEGIFAGTSTGLNVVGALRLASELGPGHNRSDCCRRHRAQDREDLYSTD